MDNLLLGVEWDVNEPQLRAAMTAARQDINGVAQASDNAVQRVTTGVNRLVSAQNQAVNSVVVTQRAASNGFNSLQNSINQITRELPAFTFSAQTGFLAISNNIPILIDQIARLRAENAALNAEGQRGVPVWKQLFSGLFSFGTALSLGVTLLTIYGKEIGNWIASLLKGSEAIKVATENLKNLNAVMAAADKQAGKQLTTLKILYSAATDVTNSTKERVKAAKALQKIFPEAFSNSRTQALLNGEEKKSFDELTESILKNARAKAAKDKLDEIEAKRLDLNWQREKARAASESEKQRGEEDYRKRAEALNKTYTNQQEKFKTTEEQLQREIQANIVNPSNKRLDETLKDLDKQDKALEKQSKFLVKFAGQNELVNEIIKGTKVPKGVGDSLLKQRQALLDKIADIDREYNRKAMTSDEEELQTLRDKFDKIRREVERFNADPKHSKVRISLAGLDAAQKQAEGNLSYRQQTEKLKVEWDRQRDLFSRYQDDLATIGQQKTDERYNKQKAAFNNYSEYLQGEIDKVMHGSNGYNLNDVEKQRVEYLTKQRKEALANELAQRQAAYNDAYEVASTVEDKIAKIREEYARKEKALGKDLTADRAAELNKQKQDAIDAVKDEAVQKLDVFKKMYDDIDYMSSESAKSLLADAKAALNRLVADGKISADLAKEIARNIASATDKVDSRLPDGLNDIAGTLENISSLVGDVDGGFGSMLRSVSSVLRGVGEIQSAIIKLGNVQKLTGIDKVLGFAQGGASIFGTLFGLGSAISNIFNSARERRNEENQNRIARANELQLAQTEAMTKLLQRQLELVNDLYGTDRLDKYKQSLLDIEKNYNETNSKLEGRYKLTGDTFIDPILERLNNGETAKQIQDSFSKFSADWYHAMEVLDDAGKGKFETFHALSSDITTAREELQKLQYISESGKADTYTKERIEQLQTIIDQYNDTVNKLKEEVIGTSFESLLDNALELFRNSGQDSAEAWSQGFDKIIENYMVQRFSREYLEQAMQEFYDLFDELAEDGLSKDDKDVLRKEWKKIEQDSETYRKGIEDVLGVTGSSSKSGGLSSQISEKITENTALELTSITRATLDNGKQHKAVSDEILATNKEIYGGIVSGLRILGAIEQNTSDTVTELKNAVVELKSINKNTSSKGMRGYTA